MALAAVARRTWPFALKASAGLNSTIIIRRPLPSATRLFSSIFNELEQLSKSKVPKLLLPQEVDQDQKKRFLCYYCPKEGKIFRHQDIAPDGLLANARFIGEFMDLARSYVFRRDCSMFVYYPPLPMAFLSTPPFRTLPGVLNATTTKLTNGNNVISYEVSDGDDPKWVNAQDLSNYFIRKLISVPFDQIFIESSGFPKQLVVMTLYGKSGKVAFFKLGDTTWTPMCGRQIEGYKDILHAEENGFFALHDSGNIECWDLSDTFNPEVFELTITNRCLETMSERDTLLRSQCTSREYLVKANRDLLKVIRYYRAEHCSLDLDSEKDTAYKTYVFDVYKLNFDEKKWERVETLGEYVLFWGLNQCFAAPLQGLRKNCIYFTNDIIEDRGMRFSDDSHDYGVYNIKTGSISSCYCHTDFKKSYPPSIWVAEDKL